MKIVVLDGYGVNPGDLSWDKLGNLCEYVVYDRTCPQDVYQRSKDADGLIVNKIIIDKQLLDRLDKLKYIGITATGYNTVDIEYAAKKGIVVTNVPAYSTNSVSQHTFTLMLELLNHSCEHDQSVKSGKWAANSDFCYWLTPQTELAGKTLGLIGAGQIASQVAKIAEAFGMNVLITASRQRPGTVSLEELLSNSDIISLHCPLNKATEKIINQKNIELMKDGVYIINTARGGVIDENAVAEALVSKKIAGFAADVLSTEPPKQDNPLINAPNTLITPHLAWATIQARTRLMDKTIENLSSFINGTPSNKVN